MALNCIIFVITRDIMRKSRFFIPPAFDALVWGSPSEYCRTVLHEKKLQLCGWVATQGKKFDDMISLFDKISACRVRRTDRRMDILR